MPMKREEFAATLKEYKACVAVLNTGMPNSTEHERRAMRAKRRVLREQIEHAPWQEEHLGNGHTHIKER